MKNLESIVRLAKLGFTAPDIRLILRIAARIHRLDEDQCNGVLWEDEETGVWHRNGAPMRGDPYSAFLKLPRLAGYTWRHQSDPRGCALYLVDTNGNETAIL